MSTNKVTSKFPLITPFTTIFFHNFANIVAKWTDIYHHYKCLQLVPKLQTSEKKNTVGHTQYIFILKHAVVFYLYIQLSGVLLLS